MVSTNTPPEPSAPWPLVVEGDDGIRPAGPPDECFYCQRKIGQPHGPECVCVLRRVSVRVTLDMEMDVPHHWDAEAVRFRYNDSSWCADNFLDNLDEFAARLEAKGECLCPHFSLEVTGMGDGEPIRPTDAPPCDAEATLNAAAPELLDACKAVLAAIEKADLNGEVLWIEPPYQAAAVHESATERLEAVIAKAEGTNP